MSVCGFVEKGKEMSVKTIAIDLETNGFAKTDGLGRVIQPYPLEIGAVLFDGEEEVSALSCFVLPRNELTGEKVPIPNEEFFRRNRLTPDRIESLGIPLPIALMLVDALCAKADRVVCHNLRFDGLVLHRAFDRTCVEPRFFHPLPKFCTMESAATLSSKSLENAYKSLVDEAGFGGAHQAVADARAAGRVAFAMEKRPNFPLVRMSERYEEGKLTYGPHVREDAA